MRRLTEKFRADRPARAELAAGAAVVDAPRGELLLLHLTEEDRWCFPKGHVEPGESVEDAARREVEEETGIRGVVLGEEIGVVNYRFYNPRKGLSIVKNVVYFVVRMPRQDAKPERGFDEGRWVTTDAARELLEFEADREVLALVESWLADH